VTLAQDAPAELLAGRLHRPGKVGGPHPTKLCYHPSVKRFLPAILLAAFIVLTAPFVGLLRDRLFAAFAEGAVRTLAFLLAALAGAMFLFALARIRDHRLLRYGGLGLVGVLLWVQSAGFRTALATVNVAEKIHVVEYGLLAWILYRGYRQRDEERAVEGKPVHDLGLLLFPILWVTFAGTLDEGMQWLVETRLGEIRDVALNILSGLCGLLFALCLEPPAAFHWRPKHWRPLTDTAALVLFTTGMFFNFANLGYLIEDPEIGRFRSWHSAEGLRQAAAERTASWAKNPPGDASSWNLEDLFLSEAGWHTRHRNSSYEHGLYGLAHHANRILEKYYQPYLDLEEFRQTGNRRFPPHALGKLQKEAPQLDPETYLSPVLEQRIYTWPSRSIFLSVLLGSVGLFVGLPRWKAAHQR